jgi:hypothetical protein
MDGLSMADHVEHAGYDRMQAQPPSGALHLGGSQLLACPC